MNTFKKITASILSALALGLVPIATLKADASSFGTVQLSPSFVSTYRGSSVFFTPPSGSPAGVIWSLYGSNTKTVYVLKITMSRITTGTGDDEYALTKRSSASSGGTGASINLVPLDSNNPSATSTCNSWTTAPTAGTSAGQIGASVVAQGAVVDELVVFDADKYGQAIVLRGTSQGVDISGLTSLSTTAQVNVTIQEQ